MTSFFFLVYTGTVAGLILTVLLCDQGLDWIAARLQRRQATAAERRERRLMHTVTAFRRGR